MNIINDRLLWDGSEIEEVKIISMEKLIIDKMTFFKLKLEDGYVYGLGKKFGTYLPFIVDELRELFGLRRRGLHKFKYKSINYIIYYLSVNENNDIVWETPLNKISKSHPFRKDPIMINYIRKLLVFCQILGLSNTAESTILIRTDNKNSFWPINSNDSKTIYEEIDYKYLSVINKTISNNWLNEDYNPQNTISLLINIKNNNNISVIIEHYRTAIETIIKKYDKNLIYITYGIIETLTSMIVQSF